MPTVIEQTLGTPVPARPIPRDVITASPLRGLAIGIAIGLGLWVAAGWAVWLLAG